MTSSISFTLLDLVFRLQSALGAVSAADQRAGVRGDLHTKQDGHEQCYLASRAGRGSR